MKLVRFEKDGSLPAFGWLENDFLYRLEGNPLDSARPGESVGPLDSVRLLAPCQPGKILAVAINYPGIEGYSPSMKEPLVFIKPGTSVCAPGDPVVNPFPELPWWGESELGVVIKRTLKNVTMAQAERSILGFTIGNDVTVQNIEDRDHHLARSKCADSFCPLGPWIDTDFDASNCLIEAIQNGEVIRRARSSQQVWQWQRVIQWLSTWLTLEPWDVVLTGNPPDTVGMRYLSHGDVYTARIEGLGELTNHFSGKGN